MVDLYGKLVGKLVGGWTNPIEKICDSQIFIISPMIRGENSNNIWVETHHLLVALGIVTLLSSQPQKLDHFPK